MGNLKRLFQNAIYSLRCNYAVYTYLYVCDTYIRVAAYTLFPSFLSAHRIDAHKPYLLPQLLTHFFVFFSLVSLGSGSSRAQVTTCSRRQGRASEREREKRIWGVCISYNWEISFLGEGFPFEKARGRRNTFQVVVKRVQCEP